MRFNKLGLTTLSKRSWLVACLLVIYLPTAGWAESSTLERAGRPAASARDAQATKGPASTKSAKKPSLDRSGKARHGQASYYAKKFHGRKMADGTRMNPNSNVAASKTLPLGTKAQVTNLENGKSAEVEIRDRGPYIEGRIVDVTPRVAEKLDMKEDGVAPVVVKPIEIPNKDGNIRSGEGATDR